MFLQYEILFKTILTTSTSNVGEGKKCNLRGVDYSLGPGTGFKSNFHHLDHQDRNLLYTACPNTVFNLFPNNCTTEAITRERVYIGLQLYREVDSQTAAKLSLQLVPTPASEDLPSLCMTNSLTNGHFDICLRKLYRKYCNESIL